MGAESLYRQHQVRRRHSNSIMLTHRLFSDFCPNACNKDNATPFPPSGTPDLNHGVVGDPLRLPQARSDDDGAPADGGVLRERGDGID